MPTPLLLKNFWEHIDDLRKTLIRCATVITCGFILCFCFYDPLISFFTHSLKNMGGPLETESVRQQRVRNTGSTPITYQLPKNADLEGSVIIPPGKSFEFTTHENLYTPVALSPLEGIVCACKLSVWCGVVGTSPIWLWFIFQFVAPAFYTNERRIVSTFISLSILSFSIGLFLGYTVTVPLTNKFLYPFNAGVSVNLWSLSNYIDYTVLLMLANGIILEGFVVLLFFVHYRIISSGTMQRMRRWMIVIFFIVGAMLAPPDVFSQCLLAIPLCIFYEIAILYAKFRDRLKLREHVNP